MAWHPRKCRRSYHNSSARNEAKQPSSWSKLCFDKGLQIKVVLFVAQEYLGYWRKVKDRRLESKHNHPVSIRHTTTAMKVWMYGKKKKMLHYFGMLKVNLALTYLDSRETRCLFGASRCLSFAGPISCDLRLNIVLFVDMSCKKR